MNRWPYTAIAGAMPLLCAVVAGVLWGWGASFDVMALSEKSGVIIFISISFLLSYGFGLLLLRRSPKHTAWAQDRKHAVDAPSFRGGKDASSAIHEGDRPIHSRVELWEVLKDLSFPPAVRIHVSDEEFGLLLALPHERKVVFGLDGAVLEAVPPLVEATLLSLELSMYLGHLRATSLSQEQLEIIDEALTYGRSSTLILEGEARLTLTETPTNWRYSLSFIEAIQSLLRHIDSLLRNLLDTTLSQKQKELIETTLACAQTITSYVKILSTSADSALAAQDIETRHQSTQPTYERRSREVRDGRS